MIHVASFYRFATIDDPLALAPTVLRWCAAGALRGSVLIAAEGINGALAGEMAALQRTLQLLRTLPRCADLAATLVPVTAGVRPFRRLRVRVRDEIVTFQGGAPSTAGAATVGASGGASAGSLGCPSGGASGDVVAGGAVDAAAWHALLDDPDVLVLDVRNDYETALGGFPGAVAPQTGHFSQFPAFVDAQLGGRTDRPVAMYCTGGIRCAKAGAWMRERGFEAVYELRGGVLGYLQNVAPEQNRWQGNCFVFDARVSVDRHLQPGGERLCRGCGAPWRPMSGDEGRQCNACRDAAA